MKLLLDQGLPASAAVLLRTRGWDALHVGEAGLATADDGEILARAREQARIVVTLNADFHALLAASGDTAPSVVRLRVEGLRAPELVDLLLPVLGRCGADLRAGAVVSVDLLHARLRRLPVVR